MDNSRYRGLVWIEVPQDLPKPAWASQPSLESIEKVCRGRLHIATDAPCKVTSYASGKFHEVYHVDTPDPEHPELLMKVSLPVDPQYMTRGEVATLRWVRENTNIPVPKVIDYQDSNNSEIGFEWILMELMPGKPAYRLWRRLSMSRKATLVNRVAEFQYRLRQASSRDNLRSIGTLDGDQNPRMERIVDRHFFWGDHIHYPVQRGPFTSSHNWLAAHLDITIRDYTARVNDPNNSDTWNQSFLDLAIKLLTLLPVIFPPTEQAPEHAPERTILRHDDLNLKNLLVDDEGNITAVLGWEFQSCQPVWVATKTPAFLDEKPSEEEPLPEEAHADDHGTGANGTGMTNGDNNRQFRGRLTGEEAGHLREVYDTELELLMPGWENEWTANTLKHNYLDAINMCAQGTVYDDLVIRWADAVEEGRTPDLMEVLRTRGNSLFEDNSDDDGQNGDADGDDADGGDADSD